MFRDVIVGENDFLSIVEKHTGGTVKRVFKDGYRNQILNINFNEEEVEKRFTHPTYGHLEYSLDDGTVAMSGLRIEVHCGVSRSKEESELLEQLRN